MALMYATYMASGTCVDFLRMFGGINMDNR
jgi:hypothetical protein